MVYSLCNTLLLLQLENLLRIDLALRLSSVQALEIVLEYVL